MKVAIVLGYRLNNDSSCNNELILRLKTLIKLNKEVNLDKVILSGGSPNPYANISEAKAMYNYLVFEKFPKDKLIIEDKSMDTEGNARNSVPLALSLNPDIIYVVSSNYHFIRPLWNARRYFENEMRRNGKSIPLIFYSDANLYK